MKFFDTFNPVDLLFLLLLIIPVIFGIIRGFSSRTLIYSVQSSFETIEIIIAIIISFVITKMTFFDDNSFLHVHGYTNFPEIIKRVFEGRDYLVYVVFTPILILLLSFIIRLITLPIYNKIVELLNKKLYYKIESMHVFSRRILGGMWNIPKSIFIILIIAHFLNFIGYFFPGSSIFQYQGKSKSYKFVYDIGIEPVLHSNVAKSIPVIVNNSFAKTNDLEFIKLWQKNRDENKSLASNSPYKVIKYFNGVTLDEAVKSNDEIDSFARDLVKNEIGSRNKAKKIYKWIADNIEYDYDKAEKVSKNVTGINSGAQVAFYQKKGICFDFSSLYVAMLRANGIKVNIVTGLAYSGIAWGDHSWNQFYDDEETRWVNVDPTFGKVNNYFDKPDFNVDHKFGEVQEVW